MVKWILCHLGPFNCHPSRMQRWAWSRSGTDPGSWWRGLMQRHSPRERWSPLSTGETSSSLRSTSTNTYVASIGMISVLFLILFFFIKNEVQQIFYLFLPTLQGSRREGCVHGSAPQPGQQGLQEDHKDHMACWDQQRPSTANSLHRLPADHHQSRHHQRWQLQRLHQ